MRIQKYICMLLLLLGVIAQDSRGAIMVLEEFDGGANGWADRDGVMSDSWDGGNLWMVGSFGSQAFPIPRRMRSASTREPTSWAITPPRADADSF